VLIFSGTGSGDRSIAGAKSFFNKSRRFQLLARFNPRLEDSATIILTDAFSFLDKSPKVAFDYVYIAPPQYKGLWKKALKKIDEQIKLISEDAWVIVQIHPVEYEPIGEELPVQNMIEFDQRHYGSTVLVFYRKP
jgi:16S rRNA G966 N2-methylase RsmD